MQKIFIYFGELLDRLLEIVRVIGKMLYICTFTIAFHVLLNTEKQKGKNSEELLSQIVRGPMTKRFFP